MAKAERKSDLSRGPNVRFPPVLLFVVGLALGLAFELVRPLSFPGSARMWRAAGVALVIVGVAIASWALVSFRKRNTAIYPTGRATQLVVAGPYRFTRNPMYLSMAAGYAGVALFFQAGWAIALLPFILYACQRLVIRREEQYMRAEFGTHYDAYVRRVRRWL